MRKNKKHIFIIILSFIITFFISLSLNLNDIQSKIGTIDYANYPIGYSIYSSLDIEYYQSFMEVNFPDFEYKKYLMSSKKITTNISYENLEINVLGCDIDFEKFPLPSCYSNSINFAKLKSGSSFNNSDIINRSNAIILYESHLKKIGFNNGDYILIDGIKFYIKGVLEDNPDVIRNISKDVIQIFIPFTTFESIFNFINVKTVIYTNNYNITSLDEDKNFISYYKINQLIKFNENRLFSSTLPLLIISFVISFISFLILQIVLIKERYNEIGIRRAVGASREEIIYSFTLESLLSTLLGIILGFISYLIVFTFIQLSLTMIYKSNFFVDNLNIIFIFILLYAFVSFFSILIPTLIGTKINISSILVEEK